VRIRSCALRYAIVQAASRFARRRGRRICTDFYEASRNGVFDFGYFKCRDYHALY